MRISILLTVALVTAVLSGCKSQIDESDAITYIHDSVKANTCQTRCKASNVKRVNGWEEGETIYKVEYGYDTVATLDYVQSVHETLTAIEANPGYFDDSLEGFGELQTYAEALKATPEFRNPTDPTVVLFVAIGKRVREQNVDKSLLDRAGKKYPEKSFDRARWLLAAMLETENIGIKPGTKAGDLVTKGIKWTATYRKTENGWVLVK